MSFIQTHRLFSVELATQIFVHTGSNFWAAVLQLSAGFKGVDTAAPCCCCFLCLQVLICRLLRLLWATACLVAPVVTWVTSLVTLVTLRCYPLLRQLWRHELSWRMHYQVSAREYVSSKVRPFVLSSRQGPIFLQGAIF